MRLGDFSAQRGRGYRPKNLKPEPVIKTWSLPRVTLGYFPFLSSHFLVCKLDLMALQSSLEIKVDHIKSLEKLVSAFMGVGVVHPTTPKGLR